MKPLDYYSTNAIPYPSKSDFTTVFVYRRGTLLAEMPLKNFDATDPRFQNATVEKSVDEIALKKQRTLYSAEADRLEREFKTDLFEEHGVLGNPKAEQCFAIAWDYGRSDGLNDVLIHFETLVDLIK